MDSRPAIKICGMTQLSNIAAVAALKPDYMGFICWPGSPRYVQTLITARDLDDAGVLADRVGVFVNQSIAEIATWMVRLKLTIVQLHGDESVEFCRALRAQLPQLEIWKAFAVRDKLPEVAGFEQMVDKVLFDTSSAARGGSGQSFDWELLREYRSPLAVVLSGGLSVENLPRATEIGRQVVSVLDLNSRIESEPGIKDLELSRRAIAIVREGWAV